MTGRVIRHYWQEPAIKAARSSARGFFGPGIAAGFVLFWIVVCTTVARAWADLVRHWL